MALIASTMDETDWKECPTCTGYGLTGNKQCQQCNGARMAFYSANIAARATQFFPHDTHQAETHIQKEHSRLER